VQTATAELLQKECHCRSPTSASKLKKKMVRVATAPATPTKHCFEFRLQQEGVVKENAIVFLINN
jgi:hypothetical protein